MEFLAWNFWHRISGMEFLAWNFLQKGAIAFHDKLLATMTLLWEFGGEIQV